MESYKSLDDLFEINPTITKRNLMNRALANAKSTVRNKASSHWNQTTAGKSRVNGRAIFGALLLTFGITIPVFRTMRAEAYVNNGCIFASRNVTYQDYWNNTPSLDQAASSWNTTNLSFTRTSSYSPDVWTFTKDWGNTGWYGLTTGPDGGPCGDIRINTFQDLTVLPPTSWKAVVTHEFGHAAGLAHSTSRFPCPFGGSSNVAVMDEAIGYAFTSSCIRDYPQADDIAGVNNKYP